ncbi:MAG: hypothetical protein JWM31_2302, partial [Solirubrobacterales bacterium]|nr:hypothetical protein [Solirubrobacterales bacterium]
NAGGAPVRPGRRVTLTLRAPARGWCPGHHTGAVFFTSVETIPGGAYGSCDEPESGSSQCEDTEVEHRDVERLLDFAVR